LHHYKDKRLLVEGTLGNLRECMLNFPKLNWFSYNKPIFGRNANKKKEEKHEREASKMFGDDISRNLTDKK